MRHNLVIACACTALITPMVQGAIYLPDTNEPFIEARLCTTGRVIRIPIGAPEKDTPPEKHRACHALCARDQDEDDSA